jgi:subtilisin family serine protease
MNRFLVLLIAGALSGVLFLSTSVAQAAVLAPELLQRMKIAAPGDKVPVIIHFADRVDLKSFAHRSDRAAARAEMVWGMRDQARRSQGPLQGFLRRQGAELTELWLINALAVQVPPALVATLAAWPGVAAVELDGQVAPPAPVKLAVPAAPSDNIAAIGVEPLWSAGFTGLGVVVASFDSGVDLNHPDLKTRWRGGTNSWFDPYTDSVTPTDVDGHGTATTSLMVGGAASGETIGVAPDARWIAAKIFPDDGSPASNSNIHLAFQWAIDPDRNPATDDAPDVVNNSWGFETAPNQCITSDFFRSDVQALQAVGIHVVFSAGNSGPAASTSVSPANYPEGLAVGSIGPGYIASSFSSRGPSACSVSIFNDLPVDVYPELVAPGESIMVAYPRSKFPFGYASVSGTSFTAPHVSGALALLRSVIPPLVGESIDDYRLRLELGLLTTTADLGPLGADNSYGRGLVDLPAAYARLTAQQYLSVYDPTAPENDDRIEFGPITPGTFKDLAFVLKNSGGATLGINNISDSTLPAPELTLIGNNCPANLLPGAQCTLTVRFAPTGFVSYSGSIIVSSNDAQQPQRTLTVTGFGNSLPPPARLLAPANTPAVALTLPVTLSWAQGDDPDGDALTMTLFVDRHADFSAPLIFPNLLSAVTGIIPAAVGIFLFGSLCNRRRLLLAGVLLTVLSIVFACGGGGGEGTTIVPTNSITTSNLSPATTYYWKVRTVDSYGGASESAVWSFTTR